MAHRLLKFTPSMALPRPQALEAMEVPRNQSGIKREDNEEEVHKAWEESNKEII